MNRRKYCEFDVGRTQVFVDNHMIEEYVRVRRMVHQPQKYGPVLLPEKPWEGSCVIVYGTVIRNPETGLYQMWYQTFSKLPPPENTYICYAFSQDGIRWVKPRLGLVEYRGSRDNNIVLRGSFDVIDSPSVIYDPLEPDPDRRYKMLFYGRDGRRRGLYAAYSRDGIRWRLLEDPVAPEVGDRTNLMLDPFKEPRYVAYTRHPEMMRRHRRRVIYRSESWDFEDWSEPELVLAPDLADSHDLQFYGMTAFPYGDMYLGFVQRLHTAEDRIDVELVWSRDNKSWYRVKPRSVFLPTGPEGGWDQAWVGIASNPPIRVGDRLWIFYEGRNASHGQRFPFPRGAIGLATLRLDGFVSINAGLVEGYLTTKAFTWPGGRLMVNLNARACVGAAEGWPSCGYVRLEILDEDGEPIKGFTKEECRPFTGDSVAHEFSWRSGKSIDELVGEKIRLRFYMVNAELYSFKAKPV